MEDSLSTEKKRFDGILYQNSIDINNKNSSQTIIYDFISPKSYVLDIGCACGDLGITLAQKKKCKIYGIENNKKSVEIALKTHCYEQIWACNLNMIDINDFLSFFHYFDFIVFGDILEHLQNPSYVIKKLLILLKERGKCIISIPNVSHGSIKAQILDNNFIYTPYGTLDETHIRFFTHKTIPSLLAKNNLLVTDIQCTFSRLNGFYDLSIYDNINKNIIQSISKDIHSYIIQYVVVAKKSSYLSQKNINIVNSNVFTLKNYNNDLLNSIMNEYRKKFTMNPMNIFKYPALLMYQLSKQKKKNLFTLYEFNYIYNEIKNIVYNKNIFVKKLVLYSLRRWGNFITRHHT